MNIDELPYVPARLQKARPPGTRIDVIVIHDMEAPEGPLTAENVAKYFQSSAAKGSAHICADNNSCVQCVPYDKQAAHAPGANTDGVGIELAGYARQTREEWLDDYSVAAMEHGADCTAQFMYKYDIPNEFLTVEMLRAGRRGWTTHWNISLAFGRSTHTDPGKSFPLDYFQSRINYYYFNKGDFLDMLSDDEQRELYNWTKDLWMFIRGTEAPEMGDNNPRHKAVYTTVDYMANELIRADRLDKLRTLLDYGHVLKSLEAEEPTPTEK